MWSHRYLAAVLLVCTLIASIHHAHAVPSRSVSSAADGVQFSSEGLHEAIHRTHAHPHMLRGHPQHAVRLQAGLLELTDDVLTSSANVPGTHQRARAQHAMATSITDRSLPPHKYFRASFFHGQHHAVHTTRHTLGRPPRMNRYRPNDGLDEDLEVDLHRPNEHTWRHMREYFEDDEEHSRKFAAMYEDSACQSDEDCPVSSSSSLHPLHTHPKFHYQWLIHMKSPITQLAIDTVERIISPYTLTHYLPHSSYLVSLPYSVALRLQQGVDAQGEKVSNSVLFVAMYHPQMKVQEDIHTLIARRWTQKMEIRDRTIQKHGENAAARNRALSHELRVTFTHPSFSPSSRPSHAALFPSHRRDTLLTKAYGESQMKKWNLDERFVRTMANATVKEVNSSGKKKMYESISAIHFVPLDSTQVVIRLPEELAVDSADADSFLSHFLARLSSHHSVQYIESHAVHTTHNKHARFVVQADLETGDLCTDTTGNSALVGTVGQQSSTVGFEAPFYSALNLYGQDQIVAIGDTGVDFDSCFFHDRNHPTIAVNSLGLNHRKVVAYITSPVSDAPHAPRAGPGDDEGHGTHTAGSLAGSPGAWPEQDLRNSPTTGLPEPSPNIRSFPAGQMGVDRDIFESLSNYSGIASAAKMVIFDFQNPGDWSLYVPNDIYHEYLEAGEKYGAMVSSNSWGDDSGIYDAYTRDVDTYLYEHPEYFMVMAAGNGGGHGAHTIATPAVAKNLLTVGSSMNGVCSFYDQGGSVGWNITTTSALNFFPPSNVLGAFPVTPASFGKPFKELAPTADVEACYAIPKEACVPLTNAAECAGKVIFVERGAGCAFSVKAKNVGLAGGVLMAYLHDSMEQNYILDAPDYVTSLPVITIDLSLGKFLREILRGDHGQDEVKKLRFAYPKYYPTSSQSESALSDFSGKGPTLDGRIKPDLLAPGQMIESVAGDKNLGSFQCVRATGPWDETGKKRKFLKETNIVSMQGTSMACPIATGVAALVRQYLTEYGHYVNPLTGAFEPFRNPSSALLKAIMISGTVGIFGSVMAGGGGVAYAREPVGEPPNYLQGFGRLEMEEVLAYDFQLDSPDGGSRTARSKFNLFAVDDQRIMTGGMQRWCFQVTDLNVPFKATLVWADPPPVLPTSLFLVNDLDLMIIEHSTSANGKSKAYVGNARLRDDASKNDGETGSYQPLFWDTDNNVEKAIVDSPVRGMYSVLVRGTHVPVSGPAAATPGQAFAVVVNGGFKMLGQCPEEAACPSGCSGHGDCLTGKTNPGVCRCHPNWAGADCALEAKEMFEAQVNDTTVLRSPEKHVDVRPDEWIFLTHTVQPGEASLTWTMETLAVSDRMGDPDFYFTVPGAPLSPSGEPVSPLTYPTLAYFQFANTDCDTCRNGQRIHRQDMLRRELYRPDDQVARKGGGQVVLGIWGYCCEPSTIKITLERTFSKV